MKGAVINLKSWNVFEPIQVENIQKICEESVEDCINQLFEGSMATIDLDGDALYLNIHDVDMENDLGRVNIDDIFDSYTTADKLATPETIKRAVVLRDKLGEMMKAIDKAVKGAKSGD